MFDVPTVKKGKQEVYYTSDDSDSYYKQHDTLLTNYCSTRLQKLLGGSRPQKRTARTLCGCHGVSLGFHDKWNTTSPQLTQCPF